MGLVGTVFGIMVTMHDMISSGAQAGIAAVAPGISEALFATAIGLFVAIPAWAYNRFTTRVSACRCGSRPSPKSSAPSCSARALATSKRLTRESKPCPLPSVAASAAS